MRELKFRAWVKSENKMDYFENYDWDLHGLDEIMQYTGLKDKNGKDIYEGDIVLLDDTREHTNQIFEIKWNPHNAAWTADGNKKSRWMEVLRGYGNSGNPYCAGACKVIGNIYENPELLKKK